MSTEIRPFSWDFAGNTALVNLLQKKIISDRLSHAYLFHGPTHVGKTTLVKYFIKSALCHATQSQSKSDIPCNSCPHCVQMEKGVHPDIFVVSREYDEKSEKKKKNISIQQIRALLSKLESASFLNSYKFGLIYEAEHLSLEAANSLLKTLEEPRRKVILILVAENKALLPDTILSRCQTYYLRNVPAGDLYDYLRKKEAPVENAWMYANLSCGLPGDALAYCEDVEKFKSHQENIQLFLNFCENGLVYRLLKSDEMLGNKKDHQDAIVELVSVFNKWIFALRDMLIIKNTPVDASMIQNFWYHDNLKALAEKFSNQKIISLIETLEINKKKLKNNVNHKLLFDNFLIGL